MSERCAACGRERTEDVVISCGHCDAVARGLVRLGHSIARFARAAEVDELVETVQDEARNYADAFAVRLPLTRREAWERHTSALSRLAALAKGGAL